MLVHSVRQLSGVYLSFWNNLAYCIIWMFPNHVYGVCTCNMYLTVYCAYMHGCICFPCIWMQCASMIVNSMQLFKHIFPPFPYLSTLSPIKTELNSYHFFSQCIYYNMMHGNQICLVTKRVAYNTIASITCRSLLIPYFFSSFPFPQPLFNYLSFSINFTHFLSLLLIFLHRHEAVTCFNLIAVWMGSANEILVYHWSSWNCCHIDISASGLSFRHQW